ncbi:DUF5696 domain-containing protein [Candidatus Izemoplasma sp. B36]|uniref:DUF5696 domain-containing protein n=1 Tax=Candidatus Izemoplasma sp. B36 TaxID=3242468 RepID=UPI003556CA61
MGKFKKVIVIILLISVLTVTHLFIEAKTNEQTYMLEDNQTIFGDEIYKSNRFTQVDDLSIVTFDSNIPDNYSLIASDLDISLYYNQADYSFIVKDLDTNYLWYSNAPNVENEDISSTMKKLYSSFVILEYYPYNTNTERLTTSLKRKYISDATITTELVENGINLHLVYDSINISFTVQIRVDQGELTVEVPNNTIYELNNNIVGIDLFPNFGSTNSDEIPGYVFIPDGPGALYRFKDNSNLEPVQFSSRYYGLDQGVKLESDTQNNSSFSMPIFGLIHGINQQGVLGIVESGDSSAQFTLIPSGANGVPYNSSYAHFILRESYVYPTNNKGDGITTVPESRFISDMKIRYVFLQDTDANYVGMAKAYREYLEQKEILKYDTTNETKLRLDILQSDSEPGILGMKSVDMTSLKEAEAIVSLLSSLDINLEIVLRGWNKGGYSGQSPYVTKFDLSIGSKNDYIDWFNYLEGLGINISLFVDYVNAYTSSKVSSSDMDLARGIYLRRIAYTDETLNYEDLYFLDPLSTTSIISNDKDFFNDLGIDMCFNAIGNLLFSSYSDSNWWSREYSVAQYLYALSFFDQNPMVQPNAYVWEYVSSYYDMPLYASQYSFYDDTVPFLQIVLRNKMDLFSPFANYFANPEEQLLRLIDFGICPSYIVTESKTTDLKYSDASEFYSTTFSEWEPKMISTYEKISAVLDQVTGADIMSRVVLQTGVVRITYSNHISIIINYTDSPYTDGELHVPQKDYYVEVVS